jgi:hypothetical protein
MVELSTVITKYIVDEKGTEEFLKRLSDPNWFQALGCVLGFDWHSSGLTTTTTGALKEALKKINQKGNIGLWCAGGKGRNSIKTPEDIASFCKNTNLDTEQLIGASKLIAKIDNSCIQDGFSLYHHCFFFNEQGKYSIVQQGMGGKWARRYHWFCPPEWFNEQEKVSCDKKIENVLNLVSTKSKINRENGLIIVRELPEHHMILKKFLKDKEINLLKSLYEIQPEKYEELLMFRGFGPKKIRALALTSKIIFGAEADWQDPVKYAFAHGGKDGIPFPVERGIYDDNISLIKEALEKKNRGNETIHRALIKLGKL